MEQRERENREREMRERVRVKREVECVMMVYPDLLREIYI